MRNVLRSVLLSVFLLGFTVSSCSGPEGLVTSSSDRNTANVNQEQKSSGDAVYEISKLEDPVDETGEILRLDTPIEPVPGSCTGGGGN